MADDRLSSYTTRHSSNGSAHPLRQNPMSAKTSRRSPYGEPTTVIRIPASLLPRVHKMLDEMRADVRDSAWLER